MVSLHGILEVLAAYCLAVVEALGYPGVFFLMVLESMVFPVPSEAVLPPAGWLASDGKMNFWVALFAATLGTLVGSLLSYWMGLRGLRPLLDRYGRYVMVTPHHLDKTQAFFERRSATLAIFLSRFVPVVRHLISIPAGGARMPLVPFCVATVLGGGLWNLILLYAGYVLGDNWEQVGPIVSDTKVIIAAIVALAAVGALVYYVMRRRGSASG